MSLLGLCEVVVDVLETILLHINVLRDDFIACLDAILDVAKCFDAILRNVANVLDANDVVDMDHVGSASLLLDVPILFPILHH